VCQPGIYPDEFPPSLGPANVKDFILQPGEYILQNGISLPNGSLRGTGVHLYNQSGAIRINGGQFQLTPPTSGIYAGILLFQARTNTSTITINGNADLAVLAGTMYAPASNGFELGSGTGSLTVGRIVGTSLSTSGSGAVTVGGS
jgi:hypothetical protein